MVVQPSAFAAGYEARAAGAPSVRDRFLHVRQVSEFLAAPLTAEDCALQSMPDASPTKWHLAHTSWFFETFLLEKFVPDFRPFDAAFRVLFNSYYHGVGDRHPRPERGLISRPDLATILAYRQQVTERVATLLPRMSAQAEFTDFTALLWLGCHHEEQHQELILTDLKHLLSKNPLRPAYATPLPSTTIEPMEPRWIACPGGLVDVGHDGSGFAFDNEGPRHSVFLQPFELACQPVTNGDYADFIADGGYRRPELWLSLGWDWRQANGLAAPMYWQRAGESWHTFTLRGMSEVDRQAPICHLSYFEADAYARWAAARLPREAEWEFAAAALPVAGNFLDDQALQPLASGEESAGGVPAQMFGDVWEWTQSAYLPYPRFRVAAGAVGEYNGKFMCNQFVLRGGSCVTPRAHMRATYRNFFPPEARWQFSGLRLARDVR